MGRGRKQAGRVWLDEGPSDGRWALEALQVPTLPLMDPTDDDEEREYGEPQQSALRSRHEHVDEHAPAPHDSNQGSDEGVRKSVDRRESEAPASSQGDRVERLDERSVDTDGPTAGAGDDPIAGIDAQLVGLHESHSWVGPLPPPQDLAAYEQVLPGAAERLVSMAERSARVRDESLEKVTEAEIDYAKTGQALAFRITFAAVVAGVVFFALGNNVAGCAFVSVPMVMLIRSFLHRKGDGGE